MTAKIGIICKSAKLKVVAEQYTARLRNFAIHFSKRKPCTKTQSTVISKPIRIVKSI